MTSGIGKDYSWTLPPSGLHTKYPYNNVTQTESGHSVEFDDTPGWERIRTQHRIGTYTEMQQDGSNVVNVVGNNYHIVAKNNNVLISGICNITIKGDSVLNVEGDCFHNVSGTYNQVVEGDYNLLVKGETIINGGKDINIGAISGTSGVYINSGDAVVINSDLHIDGSVDASALNTTGAVTAGTGIHAGVPGSVNPVAGISTLGGINVGIPGPTVPGTVTATVLVTAPAIVGSVITYGAILMDPEGGAPFIRSIYDSHTHAYHPGPGGLAPTATPVPVMP